MDIRRIVAESALVQVKKLLRLPTLPFGHSALAHRHILFVFVRFTLRSQGVLTK